jgi:hypothetical protein
MLRSDQGAALAANWNAPVALVSAALGRPAAVVGNTVPIALVAPGEVWGDRVNALDMRFAKILRFHGWRYNIGVDIINITNSDATLTYNQTLNPNPATPSQTWLAPLSVLTPRFFHPHISFGRRRETKREQSLMGIVSSGGTPDGPVTCAASLRRRVRLLEPAEYRASELWWRTGRGSDQSDAAVRRDTAARAHQSALVR